MSIRDRRYRKPGHAVVAVSLKDSTPSRAVPELWYQVRKKVGDIATSFPAGVQGPFFNDEFGDVFGIVYAVTGDGFTLPELKHVTEDIREQLLAVPGVDLLGHVHVQLAQGTGVAHEVQRQFVGAVIQVEVEVKHSAFGRGNGVEAALRVEFADGLALGREHAFGSEDVTTVRAGRDVAVHAVVKVAAVEAAANAVLWEDRAIVLHWTDAEGVRRFALRKPPHPWRPLRTSSRPATRARSSQRSRFALIQD